MKNIIGGLLFAAVLFSCDKRENKPSLDPLYYDLNLMLDQQVHTLDSINPALRKHISLNRKTEDQVIKSVKWKNELEIFREADINSPQLRETFDITEKNERGYKIVTYTSNTKKRKGVLVLQITYNKNKEVTSIFSKLASDNWLYSFERIMQLDFVKINGINIVKDFSIKNAEELLFCEEALSVLKASIFLPS